MTTSADLLTLAARVEAAERDEQHALLVEAWWVLSGMQSSRDAGLAAIDARFQRKINVEAFLDAAMMLAPEGMQFGCGSKDATGRAWAWVGQEHGPMNSRESIANAATPALALTAACLRAKDAAHPHNNEGE